MTEEELLNLLKGMSLPRILREGKEREKTNPAPYMKMLETLVGNVRGDLAIMAVKAFMFLPPGELRALPAALILLRTAADAARRPDRWFKKSFSKPSTRWS